MICNKLHNKLKNLKNLKPAQCSKSGRNISKNMALSKYTSFASDGQQHSSGIPNVPVISSGCEGGSLDTTAELEL